MNNSQPISSSIVLYGAPWHEARAKFCQNKGNGILFETAAELFIFCSAIGVRIGSPTEQFPPDEENPQGVEVPYTVLERPKNKDFLSDLYATVLFNRWIEPKKTDIQRLEVIFEKGAPSDRHKILEPYARTGVLHLLEYTKDFVKEWPLIERVWSDLAELYEEPRILGGEDSSEE